MNKIAYILLGIFMISFMVPSYSFNTQALMGMAFFLLVKDSFTYKWTSIQKKYKIVLICSIPFLISVFGLLFSDNLDQGLKNVVGQLPFLILPLVFLNTQLKPNTFLYSFKCFTISVLIYSLLVFVTVLYFKAQNYGDFLYYDKFGLFFNKHTTYTALFIVIAINYLLYLFLERFTLKSAILFLLPILFLTGILYFLSVRIAIVALLVSLTLLLFLKVKSKLKYGVVALLNFSAMGLFLLPNFRKRFQPSETEAGQVEGFLFRKLHWESVLDTIKQNSLLFGNGTGGNRFFLYQQYKHFQLTSAYLEEYNAHNQFLEIMLDYGIIGLLCFIFLLIFIALNCFKAKDVLGLSILTVFVIFFLTESVLVRQSGIILFATFISLTCAKNSERI